MATKHNDLFSYAIALVVGVAILFFLSTVHCYADWTPTDFNQFMEVI